MRNFEKINKYYVVLGLIMLFFIGLCIYTGKTVYDSLITAYQYDTTSYKIDIKIDQAKLDTAYQKIFGK
jgi:hypothetical protein